MKGMQREEVGYEREEEMERIERSGACIAKTLKTDEKAIGDQTQEKEKDGYDYRFLSPPKLESNGLFFA